MQRDLVRPAFAEPHQSFIGSDSHEPCIESRVSVEILEVCVGFQEGILHGVFGVFVISCDVPLEAENLVFIAIDKFLEGGSVPSPGGGDEKVFVLADDR